MNNEEGMSHNDDAGDTGSDLTDANSTVITTRLLFDSEVAGTDIDVDKPRCRYA